MSVLASTSGDVLNYALAVFVAAGAGLAYMLVRLGGLRGSARSSRARSETSFR